MARASNGNTDAVQELENLTRVRTVAIIAIVISIDDDAVRPVSVELSHDPFTFVFPQLSKRRREKR
jgi:hypothetical protein